MGFIVFKMKNILIKINYIFVDPMSQLSFINCNDTQWITPRQVFSQAFFVQFLLKNIYSKRKWKTASLNGIHGKIQLKNCECKYETEFMMKARLIKEEIRNIKIPSIKPATPRGVNKQKFKWYKSLKLWNDCKRSRFFPFPFPGNQARFEITNEITVKPPNDGNSQELSPPKCI